MSWRKSPPPQRFWEDEAYESWDFCENESSSSEQSKVLEALRLDGTSRGRQEQEVKVEGERHKRVVGGVEVTLVSPRRHIEMSVGGDAPDCAPRKIAKAKDDKKLKYLSAARRGYCAPEEQAVFETGPPSLILPGPSNLEAIRRAPSPVSYTGIPDYYSFFQAKAVPLDSPPSPTALQTQPSRVVPVIALKPGNSAAVAANVLSPKKQGQWSPERAKFPPAPRATTTIPIPPSQPKMQEPESVEEPVQEPEPEPSIVNLTVLEKKEKTPKPKPGKWMKKLGITSNAELVAWIIKNHNKEMSQQ